MYVCAQKNERLTHLFIRIFLSMYVSICFLLSMRFCLGKKKALHRIEPGSTDTKG